jgi:hypothetical protein
MKSILLTLGIGLAMTFMLSAQQQPTARPRDACQKPVPITHEQAKPVMLAIQRFRTVLATKDHAKFYESCAHTALRKRISQDRFSQQITGVSDLLKSFFDDALSAYQAKGVNDKDFQIGTMPDPLVPGTIIIQFADPIDAQPNNKWPKGAPIRLQMAMDGEEFRFYDID